MHRRSDMRFENDKSVGPVPLSYKFQRLRERIRTAIETGELQDRLPGERELARRFNVNAKTVNKALRDLSREGLLVRHIGLGTFVSNGDFARVGRRRVFHYFESDRAIESSFGRELIAALRREVLSLGHGLEPIRIHPPSASDPIQLSDWPSALRRKTDGLFYVPDGVLEHRKGLLSEELLLEATRRQVPILVLGGTEDSCKINAVLPDYLDAGYRLTEHVLRLGCRTQLVVDRCTGRELEAIRAGCRTAASRYGGRLRECGPTLSGEETTTWLERECVAAASTNSHDGEPKRIGVLLIGVCALADALANDDLMRQWRAGDIEITCISHPGDSTPSTHGITTYEVDVARIASWGARLMSEQIAGHRPVELFIPGTLRVCESRGIQQGLRQDAKARIAGETSSSEAILAEVMI
ncbi:MAG: GntR family transcriptional regulator [Phycisphaerae bacterium]